MKPFRPPPPYCHRRGPLSAAEHAAADAEGERQAASYYPYRGVEQHALTIAVCQLGIERLALRGVVRIRRGRVFFWHGYRHAFLLYTPDVHEYFLELMRGFRSGAGRAQLRIWLSNAQMN